MNSSTCTLPPLSDLFASTSRSSSVLDISNLLSSPPNEEPSIKAKRKRASPNQLVVLNRIFNQTYFPSTEIRVQLGKQLGMSPRAVQIWFQNKRQALRARGRQASESSSVYLPPLSPPRSPPDLRFHHQQSSHLFSERPISLPPLRLAPPPCYSTCSNPFDRLGRREH
jgi:hypothetical protein